ncbi:hypothetical protein [Oceanobacter mangrovi]|uniref:hypothetical protein n=1 Tax=Oceanobacter mangrovi TaxID=2862510 RepID=UPI001C8E23FF|nr:hypothetical protein [Oceanobacter mangrovi]
MKNEELSDLILSIKIEAKDDYYAGVKTTKYKLPEAALADEIIEVLYANFEHYDSVSLKGNTLILVHPEQDDE